MFLLWFLGLLPLKCAGKLIADFIERAGIQYQLTMMPVLTAIPRPQYVLGTISPKPTLKNVIAISHMEFNKLACSSSWNLNEIIFSKSISFPAPWLSVGCVFMSKEANLFHMWLESQIPHWFKFNPIDTLNCFWSFLLSTYHHTAG